MICYNFLCDLHDPECIDNCFVHKLNADCETRRRYNRIVRGKLYIEEIDKEFSIIGSTFKHERDKYYGRDKC